MQRFGPFVRSTRERRARLDRSFSLRQVAMRVGVQPSYLSKIERGTVEPPSEATIRRLAAELGEDVDVLLAMAGKISSDLRSVILRRPILFAAVIRRLGRSPDQVLARLARRTNRDHR